MQAPSLSKCFLCKFITPDWWRLGSLVSSKLVTFQEKSLVDFKVHVALLVKIFISYTDFCLFFNCSFPFNAGHVNFCLSKPYDFWRPCCIALIWKHVVELNVLSKCLKNHRGPERQEFNSGMLRSHLQFKFWEDGFCLFILLVTGSIFLCSCVRCHDREHDSFHTQYKLCLWALVLWSFICGQ